MLIGSYFIVPRDYWALHTYMLLGGVCLVNSALRFVEYFFLQGKTPTLLYGIISFLASIAMMGAALLNAPRPVYDFQGLRPSLRVIAVVILLIFAISVYIDAWWTQGQIKRQLDNGD